jgi:hypothetical protein
MTGQNYAASATLSTIVISGTVRDAGGAPMAGVSLNGLDVTTNASGSYSASVQVGHGWSGTVTPVKSGFEFTPPPRAHTPA